MVYIDGEKKEWFKGNGQVKCVQNKVVEEKKG